MELFDEVEILSNRAKLRVETLNGVLKDVKKTENITQGMEPAVLFTASELDKFRALADREITNQENEFKELIKRLNSFVSRGKYSLTKLIKKLSQLRT